MTTQRTSIPRTALRLMSVKLVAEQIALAALVFLLTVAWIKMPDASVVDVVGTVLLGLLVLVIAGGGEARLMLRLCGRPFSRSRVLLGAVLLIVAVAIWFGWSTLLGHWQQSDSLLAGYWNSRFPARMRNVFSYMHLYTWLEWLWSALAWVGAGVLTALAFAWMASAQPWRAMRTMLGSVTYWVVLVVGVPCAAILSGVVMDWTPGRGLAVETVSLVLRLGAVIAMDGVVATLLLTVLAASVLRAEDHVTDAGTPDDNQPRTAEAP